jgi:hypothetical protein
VSVVIVIDRGPSCSGSCVSLFLIVCSHYDGKFGGICFRLLLALSLSTWLELSWIHCVIGRGG